MNGKADIRLEDLVVTFDGALSDVVCDDIVDCFGIHSQSHIQNGKTVRQGLSRSSWRELNIGPLLNKPSLQAILDSITKNKTNYENTIKLEKKIEVPRTYEDLIVKRYDPNGEDRFQAHFDSLGPVSKRYLVFLWYLNDVDEGGETEFIDLGLKVEAKKGRLLIFPPYWMYVHRGLAPISNSKYILSTYFLW